MKTIQVENKNCTLQTLAFLSKTKDFTIRNSVANNQNCSLKLLNQLANDTE